VTPSRACREERCGEIRRSARRPENVACGECFRPRGHDLSLLNTPIIGAFERAIHTGVGFGKFVAPIEAALDHHMPRPGMYRLVFAIVPCLERDITKKSGRHHRLDQSKGCGTPCPTAYKPNRIEWTQERADVHDQ
jgi:hypothetical protein